MRHRGVAYPFPLAFYLLDTWAGWGFTIELARWDASRGDEHHIPSIFA